MVPSMWKFPTKPWFRLGGVQYWGDGVRLEKGHGRPAPWWVQRQLWFRRCRWWSRSSHGPAEGPAMPTPTIFLWGVDMYKHMCVYVHIHYVFIHVYMYTYITLHYLTLHGIALHSIPFHYITLHYITYITYIHYVYIYIQYAYVETCGIV